MAARGTDLDHPDIQYMITEALIKDFEILSKYKWHTHETAKEQETILCTLLALRLICKHLGEAKLIKTCIFKEIAFKASVFQIERLRFPKTSGLTSIAPFVRKITFLPSPFTLNLNYVFFGELTKDPITHYPEFPLRCKRHLDTHWWGGIPFNYLATINCWIDHQEKARNDHNYLISGDLQCLWTSSLLLLPQVTVAYEGGYEKWKEARRSTFGWSFRWR